jgi:hypothetical protein
MTLTVAVHPSIAGSAPLIDLDRRQASLSGVVEQLAGLRFSILLSGKWLGSVVLTGQARTELLDELRQLRLRYSNKIDEIAINYGVQAAIEAQEGVERQVTVPRHTTPPRHRESTSIHDI